MWEPLPVVEDVTVAVDVDELVDVSDRVRLGVADVVLVILEVPV